MIKSNGAVPQVASAISNSEADSDLSSDQQQTSAYKMSCKVQVGQNLGSQQTNSSHQFHKHTHEMLINQSKNSNVTCINQINKLTNDLLNPQNSLEEEEDQVSAVWIVNDKEITKFRRELINQWEQTKSSEQRNPVNYQNPDPIKRALFLLYFYTYR